MSTLRVSAPAYVPLASRCADAEQEQAALPLLDVPPEVISIVFSNLESPGDALACGLVCKPLLQEMASAPLSFRLSAKATILSAADASAYFSSISASLAKYMPGNPVEDCDILHFCQPLKKLRLLNLSGCKKLTPKLCDALIDSVASSNLKILDMQRCFQLNGASLRTMLDACAGGALGLCCLAMSHLDHSQQDVARSLALNATVSRSNLRVLAMNNCTYLNALDLASVSALCPRLTHLLLGGSTFSMQLMETYEAQLQDGIKGGCGPDAKQQLLPRVCAAVDACPALQASKCSPPSRRLVALLTVVALSLPGLEALELSFMPPPVAAAVCMALKAVWRPTAGDDGAPLRSSPPEVWDLTQEAGIRMALSAVSCAKREAGAAAGGASGRPSQDRLSSLSLALRCAVSCSSAARATPLHTAAFSGSCSMLLGLLKLGAVLDARDVGGATALFLAAEAGRLAAVKELLAAGADPAISNAAGESPLYIAALKGHLDVVRALVQGFMARKVPWHKLRYADGWTPLMAAAVADHYDVAYWLLVAAGAEAAQELIRAANRYGQSVLHIAARKGSPRLLRLLLDAGGLLALRVPDCAGDTPMDVAKKNMHSAAVQEFARVSVYA